MRTNLLMIVIVSLCFIASIQFVPAWPYQFNFSDGSLIDLNSTSNTTNYTIYVITINDTFAYHFNPFINYTILNQTINNMTVVTNLTTINMTEMNNFFYNKSIIDENYYNKNIISENYLMKAEFDSYKQASNIDEVKTQLSTIKAEVDELDNKKSSVNTWLSILAIMISTVCIFLIYKIKKESEYETLQ